jgi:hypothetical protein
VHAVVAGDAGQTTVRVELVRPAVPDVQHQRAGVAHSGQHQGGPHPGTPRLGLGGGEDRLVRGGRCRAQVVLGGAGREPRLVDTRQGGQAGDVAGGMATETVSDG